MMLIWGHQKVGHTWTPYCSSAAAGIGWCTFSEAIKMYSALYVFNQIFSRKYDVSSCIGTLRSILQSSFFLGFNAYAVIMVFCGSRRILGKFYYTLAAHLPAIIGSYLSILLERRSRRPALSFYVANIATETVWNKLVRKGFLSPIPYGEVLLFTLSTSALLYIIKKNGYGKDPVSFAFKFLLGNDFAPLRKTFKDKKDMASCLTHNCPTCIQDVSFGSSEARKSNGGIKESSGSEPNHSDVNERQKGEEEGKSVVNRDAEKRAAEESDMKKVNDDLMLINGSVTREEGIQERKGEKDGVWSQEVEEDVINSKRNNSSLTAPHDQHRRDHHYDQDGDPLQLCIYDGLYAFIRNFSIAYVGHSAASALMSSPKRLFGDPKGLLYSSFTSKKSIDLGLFVGTFSSVVRIAAGLLQRYTSMDGPSQGLAAGLVAGPAMAFYPSSSTAQYMMWKLIETVYFQGVKSGKVKYVEFTLNMLYAVSTAQLFYVAVMEPKMMRPSYTKWLNRVTRGYFALLNRNIIDIFGTESSSGYQIFYPNLDPVHTSNKFKESVLVWMI